MHAFYVYPDSTEYAEAEVKQYREGVQIDPAFETSDPDKNPNDFLWQKRTYILGMITCLTIFLICYLLIVISKE